MKKQSNVLLLAICLFISNLTLAQQTIHIHNDNPIIKITVPDQWEYTDEDYLFSTNPSGSSEADQMIVMIWASEDPLAEDAYSVIADDAYSLVETLMSEVTWDEDVSEFENNGIYFAAIDGSGYFLNEDGTKTAMLASIFLFMPDETNVMCLVYMGSAESYDIYDEELLDMILSISPK
jgi:hypothetical protein